MENRKLTNIYEILRREFKEKTKDQLITELIDVIKEKNEISKINDKLAKTNEKLMDATNFSKDDLEN